MEKWQEEAKRRQQPVAVWARRWRVSPGMRDPRGAEWYTGDSGRVGPGWIPILERLAADLVTLGWDRHLDQVKEKFGALRFYIRAGNEAMLKRIEEASAESVTTCEECGAPATRHRALHNVVVTLCPACEAKLHAPASGDDEEPSAAPDYSDLPTVHSGTCVCGHNWTDHHLVMVEDPYAVELIGRSQAPHECEFYGCNEDAGLDDNGKPHCFMYVDREDPFPVRRSKWEEKLEEVRRARRGTE
jgi:hypothetical protein